MTSLFKNTYRELLRSPGRFLAILAIIVLGSGFFVGLRVSRDAMTATADDYLKRTNFYDFSVATTLGLDDEDVEAFLADPNVIDAEGSFELDALVNTGGSTDSVFALYSLPERINLPDLVEGRLPETPEECLADAWIDLHVGDKVYISENNDEDTLDLLTVRELTVTGVATSPLYLNYERGSTSLGAGSVTAFCYLMPEAFDADYYTTIYLRCTDMPSAYTGGYDDRSEDLETPLTTLSDERGDQRYATVVSDANAELADAEAEYNDALDEYTTQRADAEKELADAKAELDDARAELEDAKKQIDDGSAELEDGQRELLDNEQTLVDARAELDDAKAELEDAKKQIDDGGAELEDGRRELLDNEQTLLDAKAELDDAKAELEDAKKQIDDGRRELEDGWRELRENEQPLLDAQAQLSDARAQLDSSRKQIDDGWSEYNEGLTQLETQRAEGERQLADAQALLDGSKAELEAGEAEYSQNYALYAAGLEQYNAGLEQYNAGLEQYNAGMAQLEAARAQLEAAEAAYNAQAQAALAAANAYLESQGLPTCGSIDELASMYPGLFDLTDLIAAERQIAALRAQCEAAAEQLASLKAVLDQSLATLEATRAQLEEAKAQLDQGRAQLDAGWEEYNAGVVQLEESKELLTSAIAQGEQELAAALAQLEDAERQYDTGLTQYYSGLQEYGEGKKQYEEGKAELEKAEADLAEAEQKYEDGLREYEDGLREYEDGLQKFNDGKRDLEDAEAELEDARQKYSDGLREYEDGRAEYESGLKKYIDGKRDLEDARSELEDARQKYSDGLVEYEDGLSDYEEARRDADREFADAEAELDDARAELDDARDEVDSIQPPDVFLLGRWANVGYACFENDSSIVRSISSVFPVFFFLVAALICITTITRMVEEQRSQLGVLMALGYSPLAVMGKFLLYSGAATVLGGVIGILLGSRLIPLVVWQAYKIMYSFSDEIEFYYDFKLSTVTFAMYLAAMLGVTWIACRKEISDVPANIIRPRAPKAGKRVLLERVPILWNRLSFLWKVTVRNIFRYKLRVMMMILGVAGCTALMLTGMGINDSIKNVVDFQFNEISLYDYTVTFKDHLSEDEQAKFLSETGGFAEDALFLHQSTYTAYANRTEKSIELSAVDSERLDDIGRFVDFHSGSQKLPFPGLGEALINSGLAEDLGLHAGDTLEVRSEDGPAMTLTVSGVYDNYIYNYVYISTDTYESAAGEAPDINFALVTKSEEVNTGEALAAILSMDDVLTASASQDLRERIGSMMESLIYIVLLTVVCAAALAFVVIYNLTNINIQERLRELATVKVLGFYDGESALYVLRENVLLTVLGAAAGIPMGLALNAFVISQINIDLIHFSPRVQPLSYLFAVALTFLFSFLVDLVMSHRLTRIDPASALKAAE